MLPHYTYFMQTVNAESEQGLDEMWQTKSIALEDVADEGRARNVTKSLRRLSGAKEVRVDLPSRTVHVTYDVTKTDLAAIHRALVRDGFKPSIALAV